MPWHVAKSGKCPAAKPWAVIKDGDSSVEGCHATKAAAQKQMAALYAKEPSMKSRHWETPRDLSLVRAVPAQRQPMELRADDDDPDAAMPVLVVRFSPFDVWYEVDSFWEGAFMERTVRGAFKKTMAESKAAIRILYDHGHDFQVGNKVLAPTDDLREDPNSAVAEGRLFDTSYNHDLLPGLEAGVYGSSFRFRVIKDEWNEEPGTSDHNPKGMPERTIREVRLFEAGPVTFPANPDATAGVRCMTDEFYDHLRARNPQVYDDLLARAIQLRAPDEPPAATGTDESDGVARTTEDEPAFRHSHRQSDVARRIRVGRVLRGINEPTAGDPAAAGGDPVPAGRDRGAA